MADEFPLAMIPVEERIADEALDPEHVLIAFLDCSEFELALPSSHGRVACIARCKTPSRRDENDRTPTSAHDALRQLNIKTPLGPTRQSTSG
jgi:hypothetical protein